MLIKSQAGEFEIGISAFELEGDELVMIGAMGVWQARIHVTSRDAGALMRLLITSGAFWKFLLKLPWLLTRRAQ